MEKHHHLTFKYLIAVKIFLICFLN